MNKIFGTKRSFVIKQNNRPRSYDVLNEDGNVMITNRRHLIPTNEKFTEKFSYGNIIPTTTRSPESVTPPQTVNSPKLITSSTTINPSKPIAPNGIKVTRSGRVSKKPNRFIEQCWNMLISVFSCVWKRRLSNLAWTLRKKKANKKKNKQTNKIVVIIYTITDMKICHFGFRIINSTSKLLNLNSLTPFFKLFHLLCIT